MFSLLIWIVAVQLVSFIALPLIAASLPSLPDRGYGVSKLGGLFLVSALTWSLGSYGALSVSALSISLSIGIVGCLSLFTLRREGAYRELLECVRTHRAPVEGLFIGGLLLFGALRAFNPEIFWGEKPMDATFLNYFIRLETLPPEDPWAAGRLMHYYYFGYFAFALLHKITGIDSGIGFNLSIATVGAFHLAALYSVACFITKRRLAGALGALAIVLLSDLDVVKLWLIDKKELNFDLYWASSRTLHSPGINEYPFWSLLFADLHAHVMALPLTALVLAYICEVGFSIKGALNPILSLSQILLGISLGLLVGTNSWDFISYGGVTLAALFLRWDRVFASITSPKTLQFFGALTSDILTIGIGILLGAGPFLLHSGESIHPGYGWVTKEEFNSLSEVLLVVGHWIAFTIIGLILLSGGRREPTPPSRFALMIIAGSLPLVLGIWSASSGIEDLPWKIISVNTIISLLGASVFGREHLNKGIRAIGLFALCGAFILTFAELVYLMDRMNTSFKFYHAAWTLLGLSGVGSLFVLWGLVRLNIPASAKTFVVGIPFGFVLPILVICLLGSVLNSKVMTTFQRVSGPRPTLNGQAYLERIDGDEWKAIDWINKNIRGTPGLLEAWGSSYGAFTRISMHTGLPVLLGWEHHIKQRGTPSSEVEKRKRAIESIYRSSDPEHSHRLLRGFNLSYLMAGNLERQTYGPASIDKFITRPDLFEKVFEAGPVRIFRVK